MTTRSMTSRQMKSSVIALVAAGVAALAILAALGTREIATNSDRTGAPVTTKAYVQAGTDAVPVRGVRPAPVYLLVAAVEQAESERERFVALDRATRPLGEAEPTIIPLVAESDAHASELRRSVHDMNVLREAEGLPLFTVVDRRGSPAASTR